LSSQTVPLNAFVLQTYLCKPCIIFATPTVCSESGPESGFFAALFVGQGCRRGGDGRLSTISHTYLQTGHSVSSKNKALMPRHQVFFWGKAGLHTMVLRSQALLAVATKQWLVWLRNSFWQWLQNSDWSGCTIPLPTRFPISLSQVTS